ncbi:ATP-dependent helicase HrpB [Deinococcus peraridilitoris]|uniref:ATP-dependent helicase HrpB n=1 Tax=Deinococcus peraridilitoris (strain DSM 19664 / LMG 22246 / CIP 109416 / KR-200) TaxID=937777 RepID=L0A422_DEIPD|nr:ATP-dependent helicase HrpB [Deinococcus peraridilitoris]AFZ68623.1 ATP-dependent helicase HrpB [Deinococcus peraridilitoris DSM 19664]
MNLPVRDALPELKRTLQNSEIVLFQAPPGAGKSTLLPLELLGEDWLAGQKIIMLQPRRLAARGVAVRMAEMLGEAVGESVGYRVRFESRVSARTRIEVVTEGILTRFLQRDPSLPGVGLVIFDEFHERSLNADLAYVLTREVQGALRDDLKVLIMSATLNEDLPRALKLNAPVLSAPGRPFPVEVRYAPNDPGGPLADLVTQAVTQALQDLEGDVLAFLPGSGEIRRAQAALQERHPEVPILPLYGDLPPAEQRRAILPDPQGARRVVLATSIAETSLTLEGVRVVVDSGFSRVSRFDAASGLTRLVTERVTRDAADQRAGRAGRTAPGVCLRLWSERTHALLAAQRKPEILEADLAPTVLELARWGVRDAASLPWPDAPPERHLQAARALLSQLDALDEDGRLTGRGGELLDIPTHPRLAHLLLEGCQSGNTALACDVAALLEERDPLGREAGADLATRVEALRAFRAGVRRVGADRGVLERIERLSAQWRRLLRLTGVNDEVGPHELGALVASAYPERVAQRRPGERLRYRLSSGQGVRLSADDDLAGAEYLAVAHLAPGDAQSAGEGRIFLAAELAAGVLEARARAVDEVRWDSRSGTLVARRTRRVGELVLDAEALNVIPEAPRQEALLEALRREGAALLSFTPEVRSWQARVLSLRVWRPNENWPDVSDEALLESADVWLLPFLGSVRKREDFARIDLKALLGALLPWPESARLDELAPARLTVPSGSAIRLQYAPSGASPVLAVKLQELFGLAETPTVNDGRTAVVLHLLSPAGRPVQVTQDLRSFWARGYLEVKKELKGRYPKHPWPDDPWSAEPTRRARPRGH